MTSSDALLPECLVIIPAYNEASRIAETVGAALTMRNVRAVVVVDDGSDDDTAKRAAEAGASVVRLSIREGKGGAIEAGLNNPSTQAGSDNLILLLDADLGQTASNAQPLIDAVDAGEIDVAIGLLPTKRNATAGGFGLVVGLSRWGIRRCTGWETTQPLSGQRCLTRRALESVRPLAKGFGVETAMSIDLRTQGFRVAEVETKLAHRVTGKDWKSSVHRARQLRDVAFALVPRLVRRRSIEDFFG